MISEIIGIVKQLPPGAQRDVLDFCQFVARQHRGKVEKRQREWQKRHTDDPPMYKGTP
ncbi:DUF2281 domain-containing protein [Synechococcus sp. C9]|uniref:DUF2281 domain-containing protein n=1 Tax=Synechococcus sp. C9 TaxID=102119 RepID=UPI001FF1B4ED|nr:DUF2281 domain-containing protein [Synechococcus sp. C9]